MAQEEKKNAIFDSVIGKVREYNEINIGTDLFDVDTSEVNPMILDYIQSNIIPLYDSFDPGHGRTHISAVQKYSIELAKKDSKDIDIAYVIASYHDIGLLVGRENHEYHSAMYFLQDNTMRHLLLKKQKFMWINKDIPVWYTIAIAIEEHRASKEIIRTPFGKIVYDADREDLSYSRVINRAFLTSLYDITPEEAEVEGNEGDIEKIMSWLEKRMFEGIYNKYSGRGYIRNMYYPETQKRFESLKEKIDNVDELKRSIRKDYIEARFKAAL
jgi:uncharacterized protein